MIGRATSQAVIATKPQKWPASETAVEKTHGCQLTHPEGTIITITEIPATFSHTSSLGKASKKNRFFLGKSPKLWVGGGQES